MSSPRFLDRDGVVEVLRVDGVSRPRRHIPEVLPLVDLVLNLRLNALRALLGLVQTTAGTRRECRTSRTVLRVCLCSCRAISGLISTGPCPSAVPACACASFDMESLTREVVRRRVARGRTPAISVPASVALGESRNRLRDASGRPRRLRRREVSSRARLAVAGTAR